MATGVKWTEYFLYKSLNNVFKFRRSCCTHADSVRVRFAPSPTGFLHLGGLRTALYNHMYAKSKNGVFILRIEDTDRTRFVENAIEKLERDLEWIGVVPDEGPSKGGSFGPYLQSERISLYQEEAKKLVENGHAYHCFCSETRLDILRRDLLKRNEVVKYDNRCRYLTSEEIKQKLSSGMVHCIRFKLTPLDEPLNDLVYGKMIHNVWEIEGDPVILKSDGFPTYHLANVVDDHYMKISHVLRGREWQLSTTKHLLLYKAFKWDPPKYAHLPLLLNEDKTKLSKRQGDVTVEHYREIGVLPIALINFLVTCGGGFSKESYKGIERNTCRSYDHLCKTFDLDYILTNSGGLKHESLPFFNRDAMQKSLNDPKKLSEIIDIIKRLVRQKFSNSNVSLLLSDDHIERVFKWAAYRISTFSDLITSEYLFLWVQPSIEDLSKFDSIWYHKLQLLVNELESTNDFSRFAIVSKMREFCCNNEIDFATFMKFIRMCLSGMKKGASIGEMMDVLGKEDVLARLRRALELWENMNSQKTKTENL